VVGTVPVYSSGGTVAPAVTPVAYDLVRDDGQLIRFTVLNGVITAPPTISLTLQQSSSGYTLADTNDGVETYDTTGKLLSITSRPGVVQTMSYDASGRLSTVTDSFGHQLILSYDSNNRLSTVTRQ
jgi:YD repeat-containing protein